MRWKLCLLLKKIQAKFVCQLSTEKAHEKILLIERQAKHSSMTTYPLRENELKFT